MAPDRKQKAPSAPREVLLMAVPNKSADMQWFTGFQAADAFPTFSFRGKKIGLLPLLEVARAKAESDLDVVHDLSAMILELRKTNAQAGLADAIVYAALQYGIKQFRVPEDFPVGLFLRLQELGLHCVAAHSSDALFPRRWIKSPKEIAGIIAGNRAASAGFTRVERILAESKPSASGKLFWGGAVLTSEVLHTEIQMAVTSAGGLCDAGLICAAGDQAVDCHQAGTGPIYQNQLIVVDIFPRHRASGNYGDMTRTYLKGRARPKQRKMVEAVLEAQRRVIDALKAGKTGAEIHRIPVKYFKSLGYRTGEVKGQYVGFFHGTGHGLGYDIHESPSLSSRYPYPLQAGQCVTVEPGLYYPGIGGCRIEDCVLITRTGCRLLSSHSYQWEIP